MHCNEVILPGISSKPVEHNVRKSELLISSQIYYTSVAGDPLVSMADPLVGFVPYSLMTGYHTMMLPPPPPEQRSPMVSRTNSPCQSNSPSRAGSPGRHKPMPTTFTRPPPLVEPLPHTPYLPPKYASMDQVSQTMPPLIPLPLMPNVLL